MSKSKYIHKSHNVTVLIYHIVCPTKYRRVVLDDEIDAYMRDVCLEIEKRYEINFLEIGLDGDHTHCLVQSVPMYSVRKVVQRIKRITAGEMFAKYPRLKKQLWGAEFWTKGYFASTIGRHGDENMLINYVKNQGVSKSYQQVHKGQLKLF